MYRAALVLLSGKPIGKLEHRDDQFIFTYDADYNGPAVSLSLPVRSQPYINHNRLHPYFASIAPEGWLSQMIEQKQKIAASDMFGQLVANGEDLIGAVQIRRL